MRLREKVYFAKKIFFRCAVYCRNFSRCFVCFFFVLSMTKRNQRYRREIHTTTEKNDFTTCRINMTATLGCRNRLCFVFWPNLFLPCVCSWLDLPHAFCCVNKERSFQRSVAEIYCELKVESQFPLLLMTTLGGAKVGGWGAQGVTTTETFLLMSIHDYCGPRQLN